MGPGFFITISNNVFSPADLRVPPGGTVTVLNQDATLHSVTSEATANAFVPGAVSGVSFDTGQVAAGTTTFTLPPSASSGTVVPYYCTAHTTMMVPQNGSITIDPTAVATTPPPGSSPPMGGGGGY